MLIAAAEATTDNSMFFFGFMGIASALVFASKILNHEPHSLTIFFFLSHRPRIFLRYR